MPKEEKLQVITVLSVESDKVYFTAFSSTVGSEIATSVIRLPLIMRKPLDISSETLNKYQGELIQDIDSLSLFQLIPVR